MEKGRLFQWHPACSFGFLLSAIAVTMLVTHPMIVGISLMGGLAVTARQQGWRSALRALIGSAAVSLLLALLNLFFNRNGQTPLFTVGNRIVTWEAAVYGAIIGMAFAAAVLWWSCLSRVMTSDRLQSLFGKRFPSFCLLVSMVLGFLPRYGRRIREIVRVQRVLSGDSATRHDRWRQSADALACATSWAAEGALVTADSMTARGYGSGKPSRYRLFAWDRRSVTAAGVGTLLLAAVIAGLAGGSCPTVFYPTLALTGSGDGWIGGAWAAFCLLPILDEGREVLTWRILSLKT